MQRRWSGYPDNGDMPRLSATLSVDDLPFPQLCASRLDGDILPLQGAWVALDEPDTAELRAASLAAARPPTFIIERCSAAWVHGASVVAPAQPEFCVARPDRVPLRCEGPPCRVREVRIASEDIVRFSIGSPRSATGTARCTGPVRTALDLLYDITLADATVERLIKHLLVTAAARAQVTARVRSARRIPHQATALARVNRLQLGAEPVCWPLAS